MSKKKKNAPVAKEEEPLGENWTNPFADLAIKVEEPVEPPPPPPPPPTREERIKATLSQEDRELLNAFGASAANLPALDRSDLNHHLERLTLSRERKGHGGKTVTLVRGLENMDSMLQMELCARIKSELGIGGRFVDGTLELQGEQLTRAAEWFRKNNFEVRGN